MSDTTKVEKWAFPFKTAGEASKEITAPQLYYDALTKASNGFYPLGANGLWHGGVHFDSGTGALLNQSEVRCIADGEVIAYRIDEKYPETLYGDIVPGRGPEPLGSKFSTGFVLVKHRLELPAMPPASAPPTGDAAATAPSASNAPADSVPAPEALTFFSLYMHLLDWAGYQAATAPKPPVFLAPTSHCVSNRTTDPLMGLRVRKGPSGGTTEVLALLPKGCKVTLGEADSVKPEWRQLLSVDEGAAVPPLPADTIGWVYAGELSGTAVGDVAIDTEPALTRSHQGLNVRQEGKLTGAIIAVLPQATALKVGPKESSGYRKVLEVTDYRGVPALPNGADGKPLGYVYHSSLDSVATEPASKDTVYLLPAPHRIKAGELIGHIGLYQDHDESTPKPRLHLEVFSCEDVPAFIAKSRARAASLPADQKTLMKIHKGSSKLIPHRADINAANPPKLADEGVTVGVDLTLPIGVLESQPADRKIQVSETVAGSTTPRISHWWRLDNLLADEAGNLISGWLAEQELITTRHSAWEWEGFEFISETTCAADHLACHLDAERLLTEAERPDFQTRISTADHGPIKERLYDIIDSADGSPRDDKLTVREIRAALSKPWHAQSISRLITHYESEWFWEEGKWDELDKLMEHSPEDPNPNWVAEKERIKKLGWWSALAGKQGIKIDGSAWHFQPIATLNLFWHTSKLIDAERFIEKYTSQHESFVANTPEFSKVSKNNLRTIVECINKYYENDLGKANLFELAYMFATARHEAYYFPTGEFFSSKPEVGGSDYFNQYDPVLAATQEHRDRATAYENTAQGDGYKYRGRGPVHLTWKKNYRKAKEHFGIDFVAQPDKVAEPENSVPIMIWGMKEGIFTGKRLAHYINAACVDYMQARRVINGTDKQQLIAGYARKFEAILRETSSAKETFTP